MKRESAGDAIPPNCVLIEIRVTELRQLFNAIDPSPFREKDLDPAAEQFIVGWAREVRSDARLALVVYLDRLAGLPEESTILREAVQTFFSYRCEVTKQRLRQLLREGRTSLVIGLAFLTAAFVAGNLLARLMEGHQVGELVRESLLIGGWVAMWRPLEILLYGWWPIRAEARLYDRLARMPVRIEYEDRAAPDAWRRDWPAMPAARTTQTP